MEFNYEKDLELKHTFDHYARLNGTQGFEYKFIEICERIAEQKHVEEWELDTLEEYLRIPIKEYLVKHSKAYFPAPVRSWSEAKKYIGKSGWKYEKITDHEFLEALRNISKSDVVVEKVKSTLYDGLSRYGYVDGTDIPAEPFDEERIKTLRSTIREFLQKSFSYNYIDNSSYIHRTINKLSRYNDIWGTGDYEEGEIIYAMLEEGFVGIHYKSVVQFKVNAASVRKLRSAANKAERDSHKR